MLATYYIRISTCQIYFYPALVFISSLYEVALYMIYIYVCIYICHFLYVYLILYQGIMEEQSDCVYPV